MVFYIIAVIVLAVIAFALLIRAIGGNFTLIQDWRKAWKFYSTYMLALVAFLPEIFNAIVSGGYLEGDPVSEKFSFWLKIGAGTTFALRMIKQVPKPKSPFDPSDSAGA